MYNTELMDIKSEFKTGDLRSFVGRGECEFDCNCFEEFNGEKKVDSRRKRF